MTVTPSSSRKADAGGRERGREGRRKWGRERERLGNYMSTPSPSLFSGFSLCALSSLFWSLSLSVLWALEDPARQYTWRLSSHQSNFPCDIIVGYIKPEMIYDSLESLTWATQDNSAEAQMDLLSHDWIYSSSETQRTQFPSGSQKQNSEWPLLKSHLVYLFTIVMFPCFYL